MAKTNGNQPDLLIQKLLREGQNFRELAESFNLEVQQHPKFPHLIWFGNAGADLTVPLVRQCRGLILDSNNNWGVVARPLDHIPEWSEPGAPTLSWDNTPKPRILDKIDGRSCYLYYYDGWYVGSYYNVDASEFVPGTNFRVAEIFWATFQDSRGYTLPPQAFSGCTFVWELTGQHLTKVTRKCLEGIGEGNRLTLTAVRLNFSGEEKDPADFCGQGIRPYHYAYEDPTEFKNLKDVLDSVIRCGLDYSEGVIVVNSKWERVAVTHPEYDSARKLRSGLSIEWVVNNVRAKSHVTIYNYAPDWVPIQAMIARCYADLIQRIAKARDILKDINGDLDYVEAAKQYPFNSILLKLRFKEIPHITDGLRELPWQELLSWLEVPEDGLKLKEVAA